MSPATSRFAALGLLVLIVVTGVAVVAVPLWASQRERREMVADRVDQIARFGALAAELPALEAELARISGGQERQRLLLQAASDTLASADLQQRLKTSVQRHGGNLTSTRVLESEAAGGFRKVGIDVRMSVDTEGLQQVLYELEQGLPLLVVEDLVVLTRRTARRRRNQPTAGGKLDVRFRLLGFMVAVPAEEGA